LAFAGNEENRAEKRGRGKDGNCEKVTQSAQRKRHRGHREKNFFEAFGAI
jgi:hypothetical protein